MFCLVNTARRPDASRARWCRTRGSGPGDPGRGHDTGVVSAPAASSRPAGRLVGSRGVVVGHLLEGPDVSLLHAQDGLATTEEDHPAVFTFDVDTVIGLGHRVGL